ncbi:MAG TPA: hypothetical protein VJ908_05835 [Wenzhouxiangellaceae bacterium]|nr:hypothetical protein [Wenzhouxiangellaceae bacterium]
MSRFTYDVVWHGLDDAGRAEIIAFWNEHGAITDHETARRRVDQVVAVARSDDGVIAGVCTALKRLVPDLAVKVFYYRTFIAPRYRNGLVVYRLLQQAVRALESYSRDNSEDGALGVYLELENPSFGKHLRQAVWRRKGLEFTYIGRTPRGLERRVLWFGHSEIR